MAEQGPKRPHDELLDAALRLLSARRRSVRELRERLSEKGFSAGDVARCLDWLLDREYLNDKAFAQAFVRDRIRFSPRSSFLLQSELHRKGVEAKTTLEAVQGVFKEEGVSDPELCRALARSWVRKRGLEVRKALTAERFSPLRERARRRLQGFLARRGFRGEALTAGLDAGFEEAGGWGI
ncbi:regulatory protein RecX [Gemmatimonadota bacterium]